MAEAHVGNGDFEDARAFAYVYLCDVLHAPHVFICRAMEQACGATAFQLAASPRGAGIMRFNSPEERDEIVAMSPVVYEDNSITIERHEEADNRFYAFYWVYAEVVVMDYPLEHWEEESAREVLATLGNVCCLDQTCFSGGDYTSIRAVLRLDHHCELPEQLLVRNHNGPACLYTVYMVRTWLDAGPEPDWGEYDFGNGPELHTAPRYHPVGNPPPPHSALVGSTEFGGHDLGVGERHHLPPASSSGSHQAGDPVPETPGGHPLVGSVPPVVWDRWGPGAATVHGGERRELGCGCRHGHCRRR
jgi:hypothetical protein